MKKIRYSVLFLIFLTLIASALLISCNNENKDGEGTSADSFVQRTECAVTFDSNGGSKISSITVYKNSSLNFFDPPVRDDYVFVGWTHEGRDWIFGEDGDLVKSDMTLYANWVRLNSIFKYEETNGEITVTDIININDYSHLILPERFNGMPITGIGDEIFKNITINTEDSLYRGLKSISFPKSVTKIGESAFEDCSNLEINFDGEITQLGENAFYGCNTISQIKLGDGIETIPFRAFSNCSLKSVIIPDSVQLIDENAFELSIYLQTAVIPIGVKIEDSAFRDCVLLRTVFFRGNESQFGELTVNGNNDPFESAKVYYYSELETVEKNKFWKYDDRGTPTIID